MCWPTRPRGPNPGGSQCCVVLRKRTLSQLRGAGGWRSGLWETKGYRAACTSDHLRVLPESAGQKRWARPLGLSRWVRGRAGAVSRLVATVSCLCAPSYKDSHQCPRYCSEPSSAHHMGNDPLLPPAARDPKQRPVGEGRRAGRWACPLPLPGPGHQVAGVPGLWGSGSHRHWGPCVWEGGVAFSPGVQRHLSPRASFQRLGGHFPGQLHTESVSVSAPGPFRV